MKLIQIHSLDELKNRVNELIDSQDAGAALDEIRGFVDSVINDDRATGEIFASPSLDEMCKSVGVSLAATDKAGRVKKCKPKGTVVLISDLVLAGGHIELIKDIVVLKLFELPVRVLVTDIFNRVDNSIVEKFESKFDVSVKVVRAGNSSQRAHLLLDFLYEFNPNTLILLNHNQDSVAIATAHAYSCDRVIFIHHADHHLALGVTTENFIHVDPSNIGFFHCRKVLRLETNFYWPLVLRDLDLKPKSTTFLENKQLVTCSCGRLEKFLSNGYLFDYVKLIPKLLSVTKGIHLHIGNLNEGMLRTLEEGMTAEGLDIKKFVHVNWVPSLAETFEKYNVDLYISSFPLGGAKSMVEAMAVGLPILVHESYRSRFHGGVDIAYKNAWVWRNERDFIDVLSKINRTELIKQGVQSRAHYCSYHKPSLLKNATDFSKPQDVKLVPALRSYSEDTLQKFLDRKKEEFDLAKLNFQQNEAIRRENEAIRRENEAIRRENEAIRRENEVAIYNLMSVKFLFKRLIRLIVNKVLK